MTTESQPPHIHEHVDTTTGGKPCKDCMQSQQAQLVYTDGEDFWKWDQETELFRLVNFDGEFYPLDTHPGLQQASLVGYIGKDLVLAKETDIVWRTVRMVLMGLREGNWMPSS